MNEGLKRFIARLLGPRARERARAFRLFTRALRSGLYSHDLTALAQINKSDKWGVHRYTQHYQRFFGPLRRKRLRILEIGVGGFDDPYKGGASLRMWKHFFPRSLVYGIDIHEKRLSPESRIRIYRGSQTDEGFLNRVVDEIGGVDIVIDDGSHVNAHVVRTFEILFPRLSRDGLYVVEDMQTAYWPHMGGDSADLANPATSMNFFKRLVDGVNHREFLRPGYEPTYYDRHITAIHFFHNLVIVQKGDNSEPSNIVRDGRIP